MVEADSKNSDAHDKAKAELLASDQEGSDHEETFQDCLDEIQFAKQVNQENTVSPEEEAGQGEGASQSGEESKDEQQDEDSEEPYVEENLETALATKQEATSLFKAQDFDGAISKYSLAAAQCPSSEPKQKAMIFNNLGMVLMKLHQPKPEEEEAPTAAQVEEQKQQLFPSTLQKRKENANRNKALEQARDAFAKAIELDKDYVKPLYWRMQVWKEEEEYEEAVKDAKVIEQIDPTFRDASTGKTIRGTIIELEKLHKEKFDKMKDEVVGGLKSLGNMFLGNFGMSVDNFQMAQNPDGTYNIQYRNN